MFQDEGRFGRISDLRRCWAPPGFRPDVPAQIVREYTYVFAAASPHDGTVVSLILPEVNALMMSIFLEEVARCHPNDFILMFMDQASWHKSQELKIPQDMKLFWLPAYSPQCNPVEHIWDEMREKWFANKVFDSMDAVENMLMDVLVALGKDKERIAGLTGFDWIIDIHLNAT